MNERLKQSEEIPAELNELLKKNKEASDFFSILAPSYKRGYCDWVGSAKQEPTRKIKAEKALAMLNNKQKTLKT